MALQAVNQPYLKSVLLAYITINPNESQPAKEASYTAYSTTQQVNSTPIK
jgi:hypothetical protein